MKFRTELTPVKAQSPFQITDKTLLAGSCFADNIGEIMQAHFLDASVNPAGTIYNPLSLAKTYKRIIYKIYPEENELIKSNGNYCCYDFHSSLSGKSKKEALENISKAIDDCHEFFKKSDNLILTFGSSFVYTLKESGEAVANCHKQSPELFKRELADELEMFEETCDLVAEFHKSNPMGKIILTVSPVRHLRDSFQENTVSKSLLHKLCYELQDALYNVEYFPAYELIMDDLRDYRFYENDLLHPNEQAVEYIWQKFIETWFDSDSLEILADIKPLRKRLNHRPRNINSEEFKTFEQKTAELIKQKRKKYPFLKF